MKKIICAILSIVMIATALMTVGCGGAETLKFGMGVYTSASATSAEGDTNGQGKITMNVAAVTVDAAGKIVACDIDTADFTVSYTSEGKAIANDSFLTKREQGDKYNMKLYGGSAKEWYEQADAFESVVCGKTLDEVKALVADANKGTEEVINAGCTIMVNDFVLAVEKAYKNAVESNATAKDVVKVGTYVEQSCKDADGDAKGQNKIETTFFAAAVDANGKVVVSSSDCVQVTFTFDANGASSFDGSKGVSSKKELGDNYGMKLYGGAAKEWYEQAAAFDAACAGKTVSEIGGLVKSDNYGTDELTNAGCTILVNGFVKAAAKIG